MKVLTKTAIDETTVATFCLAKTQINKTQQFKESSLADVFLSLAAVGKHEELKTQNDKRFQFSINKFLPAAFLPSTFIYQNFDQSWSRLSFVGANKEL